MLCAGPRTAAREHSVAVQLFATASRLMVIAFECDAVSLVMMSGKPGKTLDATTQRILHLFYLLYPRLLSAEKLLMFGAASWRSKRVTCTSTPTAR